MKHTEKTNRYYDDSINSRYNNINSKHTININFIDHIPLKDLILKSPVELFTIRKQCLIDYELSKYRKNWICNIIEMKYNNINDLLERAKEYFKYIDKYKIGKVNKVSYFIKDEDNIIKVEFIRNDNSKDITDIRLSMVTNNGENNE